MTLIHLQVRTSKSNKQHTKKEKNNNKSLLLAGNCEWPDKVLESTNDAGKMKDAGMVLEMAFKHLLVHLQIWF